MNMNNLEEPSNLSWKLDKIDAKKLWIHGKEVSYLPYFIEVMGLNPV